MFRSGDNQPRRHLYWCLLWIQEAPLLAPPLISGGASKGISFWPGRPTLHGILLIYIWTSFWCLSEFCCSVWTFWWRKWQCLVIFFLNSSQHVCVLRWNGVYNSHRCVYFCLNRIGPLGPLEPMLGGSSVGLSFVPEEASLGAPPKALLRGSLRRHPHRVKEVPSPSAQWGHLFGNLLYSSGGYFFDLSWDVFDLAWLWLVGFDSCVPLMPIHRPPGWWWIYVKTYSTDK